MDKRLTVPKWVLIVWQKIPQMPINSKEILHLTFNLNAKFYIHFTRLSNNPLLSIFPGLICQQHGGHHVVHTLPRYRPHGNQTYVTSVSWYYIPKPIISSRYNYVCMLATLTWFALSYPTTQCRTNYKAERWISLHSHHIIDFYWFLRNQEILIHTY